MSRRVGLLHEKSCPTTSRLLDLSKLAFSILHEGVIAAALILIYQIAVAGGKAEDIRRAMIFIGLIPASVALTLTNRSYQCSLAGSLKPGNKLMFYPLAITICLTLLIFLIPAVSGLFRLSMPVTGRRLAGNRYTFKDGEEIHGLRLPGRLCLGLSVQRKLYQWSKTNPEEPYRELWNWITDLRNLRCAWVHVAKTKVNVHPVLMGQP